MDPEWEAVAVVVQWEAAAVLPQPSMMTLHSRLWAIERPTVLHTAG